MSTVWENSQLLFHQILILPHSLCVWDLSHTWCLGCVHRVSCALGFLFSFYILLLFASVWIFLLAYLSSTNPSSCCVHSAVKPTWWVLNFRFELLLQYSFQIALLRFHLQTVEFTYFRQTKLNIFSKFIIKLGSH